MEMDVDEPSVPSSTVDWPGRWNNLRPILERSGPFARPEFSPGSDNFECVKVCKILVVGAGGLGCELLKDLALMGFRDIQVIDMDTIDTSNLNRQFLFRAKDVGRSKAEVAAEFINRRVPGCNVIPHYCQIQDKTSDFYQGFNIVVCGLDSVVARRWLNAMLVSILRYDQDGNLDNSSIVPLIDGGTEGFKGNARIILPGLTPCIECTLNLYPPQVNFPLCTIAHTPRMPEHCIEFARVLLWPKEKPFGGTPVDGDNPKHIQWILEKALERANQFGIQGVTYRLTQGVVKHIIPAVASTNASIAAICALEVFKMATCCALPIDNYLNFQDADGIYTSVVSLEKSEDCAVCSQRQHHFPPFPEEAKLQQLFDFLVTSPKYQMKSPAITAPGEPSKTLYIPNIASLEKQTKPNLKKTLQELGLQDGQHLYVADPTSPTTMTFLLKITSTVPDDPTPNA